MARSDSNIPSPPARPADGHKGTFGTVVVFGGSPTMIGAPAIAAGGALRGGAGLAKIAAPQAILPFCLTIEPSATGLELPNGYDARQVDAAFNRIRDTLDERTVLAIGPGMGVGEGQQRLLGRLLSHGQKVVLDADGLNNLAQMGSGLYVVRCPAVLTPHPGEFRRLAGLADIGEDPTKEEERPLAASKLARAAGGIVVLKGSHTVVADGTRTYINQTGNPALSTAGSGDVLTGLIAALIAQGMEVFDAAVLGVYVHGKAADEWAHHNGNAGLTARDLIRLLPRVIHHQRHRP